MTRTSGPTAAGEWAVREVDPETAVLVRRAVDGSGAAYCVSDRHRLVRDARGSPVVSLTLVLQGVPESDEQDVLPRVRQGALALTVTLDPPPGVAAALGAAPLYVREGAIVLRGDPDRDLATEVVSGTTLTASLRCTLDRDDTLAVLSAFDGGGAPALSLASTLWYRAVEPPGQIHLTGSWAAVHDVLVSRPATGGPDLHRLFDDALAAGAIVATPGERPDGAYASFASMARAVLLDADGRIGRRPSEYFDVDLIARSSGEGVDRTLTVLTPLAEVLGGAFAGLERGRFVSIVGVTANAPEARSVAVPRRVRGALVRGDRDGDGRRSRIGNLAVLSDGRLASTDRVLQLSAVGRGNLYLELAKTSARPWEVGVHATVMNDLIDPGSAIEDLPVVSDPAAAVFDGRDLAPGWYSPGFEIIRPDTAQDASSSPFVFSFRRVGTALDGTPGLEATVTLKLRRGISAGAQGIVAAGGPFRPVATNDLQAMIDLPFRDASGAGQRQRFPAAVSWDGEVVTATVSLLDAWARMAYGAISQPGFQVEPARIALAWTFPGWHLVTVAPETVVWGGKSAVLPIRYATIEPIVLDLPEPVEGVSEPDPLDDPARIDALGSRDVAYFDASSATYRDPVGDFALRVRRDVPGRVSRNSSLFKVHTNLTQPNRIGLGELVVPTRPKPTLPLSYDQYFEATFVRSQVLDLLIPCAEFGACYLEQRDGEPVAIGCVEALRLGQTAWRQYAEMPALADPAYKVFRSLQQPGHFLALPTRYVVGRHPESHPSAPYGPAILLHALLDPADPAQNEVVIQATLAPDISAVAWNALRVRLRGYAAEPTLSLASDVECTPSFTWTVLGMPSVTVPTVLAPSAVSVAVQSDLAHALLLRDMLTHDGIAGTMTLALPDGTTMSASLLLGLSALAGPEPRGPLEVTTTTGTVTLVNRIERPVNVTAVRVDDGRGSIVVEVPVEQTVPPDAATSVSVDLDPTAGVTLSPSRCWPVYSVPPAQPAQLQELRTFVEDIWMNVVFMDLVDHAGHGLSRLDVRAQLVGASTVQEVAMSGAPASGSASFVLPLTTYLAQRQIRYQVSATRIDGTATDSGWLTWDVAAAGCLISLTWDALGLT